MDIWRPTIGMCEKSNIDITQRYQNKVLRCLVNVPWYSRNSDIHGDLCVETVASSLRDTLSHMEIVLSITSMKRPQRPGSECATFNQTTQMD
jgi:hypothetical protein